MRRILTMATLYLFFTPLGTHQLVFGYDWGEVNVHGFVSQGYLKSSDNNYLGNSKDGSFQYNEIGINFSSLLSDDLRFGTQLFSRDLGDHGNNTLMVDWAFLDYSFKDWLGVRSGKIKTPFGLYNRRRDADMLRTSILMPQSVYHEGLRDLVLAFYGVSFYGNVKLSAFGNMDYEVFGGTVDVPGDTPYIKDNWLMIKYTNPAAYVFLTDVLHVNPYNAEVVFRQGAGGMLVWQSPLKGLRFSVTDILGDGEYGSGELKADLEVDQLSVISIEYDLGGFTFAAERLKVETVMDLEGQETGHEIEGYYGSISWEVVKWLTIGTAYGEYYPDAENKDGDLFPADVPDYWAWQKDITFSVRFNINEYLCIKLETHYFDGLGLVSPDANEPLDEAEQYWMLYAVKASLNF